MVKVGKDTWKSSSPIILLRQKHLESRPIRTTSRQLLKISTTSLGNLFQCSITSQ